MTLKDKVLNTIGAVGLAGLVTGLTGMIKTSIPETPAVGRIFEINRQLYEKDGYTIAHEEFEQFLTLKGEHDTLMSNPLVRSEYSQYTNAQIKHANYNYILLASVIPFTIAIFNIYDKVRRKKNDT